MNSYILRALVALLFAAFLWAQARAAQGRPHRKRAFEMAAAALLALAAFNGSLAAGAAIGPLQLIVAAAGLALFVGAIVSLVLSLRHGEMREQSDKIASAAREDRERRMTDDQRPTTN